MNGVNPTLSPMDAVGPDRGELLMANGSIIPENSPRGVVDWVPADVVVVAVVVVVVVVAVDDDADVVVVAAVNDADVEVNGLVAAGIVECGI